MKFAGFSLTPLSWRLRREVPTSRGTFFERRGVGVELRSTEGDVGLGEATPLVEFGQPDVGQVQAELDAWLGRARGRVLPESVQAVAEFLGDGLSAPARHALELGLLDLLSRRMRVPLSQLLNPMARSRVPVSALLPSEDAEANVVEAADAVRRGFRTLKLKVGRSSWREDVRRVERVRAALGPGIHLRLDANGAWTEEEAALALEHLGKIGVQLVEQPVAPASLEALARLTRRRLCPVAADEALARDGAARRLLDSSGGPGVDVLVLKPVVLGGLLPALELGRRAAALGLGAFVTHAMDGVVSRLGAVHLAAALPESELASGVTMEDLPDGAGPLEALHASEGFLNLTTEPGLGHARVRRAS